MAPNGSVLGAVAAGIASAVIGVGVVWGARSAVRARPPSSVTRTRVIALAAVVVSCVSGPSACRQLYSGPPVVRDRDDRDGIVTKRVRAKREPDRLIAEDLSVCWVIPEVYAGVKPGDHWRCAWRHIPGGQ